MQLTIQAGSLEGVVTSLGSIEGKKSIPLAVKLVSIQDAVGKYVTAYREQDLNPAILEFNKGKERNIEGKRLIKFLEDHEEIFTKEVEVEVETLTVEELSEEGLTIDSSDMAVLLAVGVVVK